jgi:hypothetical protein
LLSLFVAPFRTAFFLTISLGDGVSKKSRLSILESRQKSSSAERIKLDDEGRTERAF